MHKNITKIMKLCLNVRYCIGSSVPTEVKEI